MLPVMLAFDDALQKVLAAATPIGTERVELVSALGRVLREDLIAHTAMPAFDYSAMDGYAVRIADFNGDGPLALPVVGESQTGHPAPTLEPGTTCRIFTGAQLPDGADAVVMQENVERQGNTATFSSEPPAFNHVRRKGEDLEENTAALTSGTRLSAGCIGLIAALDRMSVLVSRRPRVVIVCTGDELRPPGSRARPGSIPESNGYALSGLIRQVGCEPLLAPLAPDDMNATKQLLEQAVTGADVLLTVGGVSVGDHDVVRPALESLGATLDFYKVRIKPGKPLAFGRIGKTLIFGLPGNPVSAQVTFTLFGAPLLRSLQQDATALPRRRRAKLLHEIRQKPGRRAFSRGRYQDDGGVEPMTNQASGSPVSMARADALIDVPHDAEHLPAGSVVDTIPLAEL